jgi:hypothetical protein
VSEHAGDCEPKGAMRIHCDALDALRSELAERAAGRDVPTIHDMPWGSRDMLLTDPFGNRLTFTDAITARADLPIARAIR